MLLAFNVAHVRRTVSIIARCVGILWLASSCESKAPEIYEVPYGYRGWVEVLALRSECPPIPKMSGTTIFHISSNGVLCTSSPIAFGYGRVDHYYVKGKERVRLTDDPEDPNAMIWQAEYYGHDGVGPEHERERDRIRFFVGTKKEYNAQKTGR